VTCSIFGRQFSGLTNPSTKSGLYIKYNMPECQALSWLMVPVLNVPMPSAQFDVVDGAVVAEAATNSSVARERKNRGSTRATAVCAWLFHS
jgi:hypothetical protein